MAIFTGGSSGGGGGSTTSGGGVAARYLWNTGVGTSRPAAGNVKRRVSSTPNVMRLNYLDTAGANWRDEWLGSAIGQRLIFKSASTTNFAIIVVAAATADIVVAPPDESESNVEIQYTLESGSFATFGSADATTDGVLGWSNYEPCYVQRDSGSEANVTLADLSALANFAYFDANFNLYDLNNNIKRSGTQVAATVSALPAAASNIGNMYLVTEVGTHGTLYFASDKTGTAEWLPLNGIATIYALGSPISAIAPASTFTSVTATSANSGTDIQLASAGVHGLTTSPAVGCKIYVSAGTNWTAGFYTIKSITNTTTLVLEESWVASMGSPTIVLADNATEMPVIAVSIPPMLERSAIKIEIAGELTASTNGKKTIVDFGSMHCYNKNNNGSEGIESIIVRISNQGSKTAQKTHYTLGNNTGYGSTAGVALTGNENTANAVTLYLRYIFQTANEVHSINSFDVIRVD